MTTLKSLCNTFVARSKNLSLTGKKRDTALIEFMSGAAAALDKVNHEDAAHVRTVTGVIFASRGFAECEKIARDA